MKNAWSHPTAMTLASAPAPHTQSHARPNARLAVGRRNSESAYRRVIDCPCTSMRIWYHNRGRIEEGGLPSIAETRFQMVQLVFPEDISPRGTLYGGRMMYWIATAGTLTASRCARGPVVLGAMDDLDFLHPVHLGEIVTVSSQVEFIGRASLELGVEVHSEHPRTGTVITPATDVEAAAHAAAAARKAARIARPVTRSSNEGVRATGAPGVPEDLAEVDDLPAGRSVRLSRLVMPEDALSGTLMFAGKLLATLDEIAAISAIRYCHLPTVTASLDTVYFYHPLRVGQVADLRAVLTHVGRSSMEIGVRVDGEEPRTGRRHHTCTAFLTMVHLDADGRPAPVPAFTPQTPEERRLWREAEARRVQRRARVARLRERVGYDVR
ncbi:MAG: acyl-CoA thioesterase [Bacillati bacterium ANGP1]|uniref:Acyl-CoA thioesterase n=1 Tax=Candidatus Segetimicrobium genomatis TaxID=2569760 RepID=A0A537IZL3_9BACT|nr:MAG: acyl-CoA thioesterase [Terrabacteria group bacterium ANGP1]